MPKYNGYELPALPEWDKEKYPYAVISVFGSEDSYIITLNVFDKLGYIDASGSGRLGNLLTVYGNCALIYKSLSFCTA